MKLKTLSTTNKKQYNNETKNIINYKQRSNTTMKLKTLLTTFITFTLFSLFLSSCDKKDAILVNRRTATPEIIKEIEEERGRRQQIEIEEERERRQQIEREEERERERQRAREEEEERNKKAAEERRVAEEAERKAETPVSVVTPPSSSSSMEECAICLQNISIGENCTTCTKCKKNPFHTECIKEWLKHERTCPNCRAENSFPPSSFYGPNLGAALGTARRRDLGIFAAAPSGRNATFGFRGTSSSGRNATFGFRGTSSSGRNATFGFGGISYAYNALIAEVDVNRRAAPSGSDTVFERVLRGGVLHFSNNAAIIDTEFDNIRTEFDNIRTEFEAIHANDESTAANVRRFNAADARFNAANVRFNAANVRRDYFVVPNAARDARFNASDARKHALAVLENAERAEAAACSKHAGAVANSFERRFFKNIRDASGKDGDPFNYKDTKATIHASTEEEDAADLADAVASIPPKCLAKRDITRALNAAPAREAEGFINN